MEHRVLVVPKAFDSGIVAGALSFCGHYCDQPQPALDDRCRGQGDKSNLVLRQPAATKRNIIVMSKEQGVLMHSSYYL